MIQRDEPWIRSKGLAANFELSADSGTGDRVSPAARLQYRLFKRALDLVLSCVTIVLTAPLFLLIAVALRCSSARPVLFRQQRVGLHGRVFWICKFRTMEVSPRQVSDIHWTGRRDSRVTPVGRVLRYSSLDELPQLVNVLKGEMSLVGPRPERPHFVERFEREMPAYSLRHTIQCGLTGWAQVNGWRGDTSIQKRLEYDLYYLQNWSLAFDLKILLLTLSRGFFNRNAC
ncbi:MAG: exopolysaccharide biosynthesis polyprenyl glycosylphosphotransferase [Acidobacteria bacterium]|nr:exopolysaccharide biosynthesis polyprenyl glycosylphosphotransferase [Acidobacteriota bacterium]MCI0624389.1 exopolysaccharide biosynthesis polyprenyl glycosylphosphotransferase [Acidobacteriota bacterium]MCI0723464.1 exopolysaccharide biosynthesis polyprenyl glycosylphosphotransferase [Acidobacteriota bacterium]